jgi:hypothetical protein
MTKAQAVAVLQTAQREYGWLERDQELSAVEHVGLELLDNLDGEELPLELGRLRDEAAAEYAKGLTVDTREGVAWAVRKILDARDELSRVKAAQRSEVARAKRQLEAREEWFRERIYSWFVNQERDTPSSVRLPEAQARIQAYTIKSGVRIEDERLAVAAILEDVGTFEALRLGLIESIYKVRRETVVNHVLNTGQLFSGVSLDPQDREAIKLVGVRADKKGG